MLNKLEITNDILNYVRQNSLRDNQILSKLRQETLKFENNRMQVTPEQGQFLSFIVKLIKAQKTLEIGVFTGYSTLCTALALPSNGKIVAFDINEEYFSIGCKYFEEAGIREKIDFRLGDAKETLKKLLDAGEKGTFDFAFIDADKVSYEQYYEYSLELVKTGGLIILDNTLWKGNVLNPKVNDPDTKALKIFNTKLLSDNRVDITMLPIYDGLTLLQKR